MICAYSAYLPLQKLMASTWKAFTIEANITMTMGTDRHSLKMKENKKYIPPAKC